MPLPCKYRFPILSRWRIRDASPLSYYTAYPFTSTNTINPTKMMRPTNLWARKKGEALTLHLDLLVLFLSVLTTKTPHRGFNPET